MVPILVLTTESAADLKDRARAAGASGWIVKPFDEDKLLWAIERVAGPEVREMSSNGTEDFRSSFFEECEELLESMHDGFDLLAGGGQDGETMNAIFRAVHSIKGGAGAFGFTDLVAFAHQFETALDHVRSGKVRGRCGTSRSLPAVRRSTCPTLSSAARNGDDDVAASAALTNCLS